MIMTDQLDRSILDAQRSQERAREEAEEFLQQAASVTSNYVVALAEYFMNLALKDKPEVIQNLPQEQLSALKSQYNDTLRELPDLTRECVLSIAWPHRSEIPEELRSNMMASFDLGRQAKETIDQVVRELAGHVGILLVNAGLADVRPHSQWKSQGQNGVAYAYGLPDIGIGSGDEYKKLHDLYKTRLDKYVEASRAVYRAQRAKQQADAEARWDES